MRGPRARATTAVRGGIAREERAVLFGGTLRRRRRPASRRAAVLAGLGVVAAAVAVVLFVTGPAHAAVPPPDAGAMLAPAPPADGYVEPPAPLPPIAWRESTAVGAPWAGRLRAGVQLPEQGPDWFTWDGVRNVSPNRGWRRWGTDALIRTLISVLREYRTEHPEAPRVGIGDLSRRHGGWFGREFGGLGHASHQNGLDADVWYPRTDHLEARARRVSQVDRPLAQALVDAFRDAGAQRLFVGPHVGLHGPRGVVIRLAHHDDHVHVRIAPPPA